MEIDTSDSAWQYKFSLLHKDKTIRWSSQSSKIYCSLRIEKSKPGQFVTRDIFQNVGAEPEKYLFEEIEISSKDFRYLRELALSGERCELSSDYFDLFRETPIEVNIIGNFHFRYYRTSEKYKVTIEFKEFHANI